MAALANNTNLMDHHMLSDRNGHCIEAKPISSIGAIWSGDNPLDYAYSLFMFQIILVVVTSRVLQCLLMPLGQTKLVCNLLGGIILGPSGLGHKQAFRDKIFGSREIPLFDTLSLLGTAYFLFLIGVKVDVSMVKRMARNSLKIGLAGFLLPLLVTTTIVSLIAPSIPRVDGGIMYLFLATISMSFSYFADIAQALNDLDLMTSELGQLALSSAIINDVFRWILTAFYLVVTQPNATQGVKALLSLLGLIFFTIRVIRPAILLIIKNTPEGTQVKEHYIVAIQLGVLVMAFISDAIGLKYTAGPLILGLCIPDGPPLGATLTEKIEFIVSEVFMPIFFFRVGIGVDVHFVRSWTRFTITHAIIFVSFVAKMIGITLAALCCKIKFKNSILLGMIMNIKGLIELIAFSPWKVNKDIDDGGFTRVVLFLLVFTMIITPIVRFSYKPQVSTKVGNIQSIATESGTFRILCCIHNEESVLDMITLLEASYATEKSPISAYVIHAIELVGRAAPLLTPCNKESKSFRHSDSTTNQMVRALDSFSKQSKGSVVVQTYRMIAPYKSMHDTIFDLAQDKRVPLIIIPFHENHHHSMVVGSAMTGSIRQFNLNVQALSPCTVGILVNRGLPCKPSLSNIFSYNMAVFFIGGPDDREALAYASRMCGNPRVQMTVFRFILKNKVESNEEELMNESFVEEFQLRHLGNYDRVHWRNINVDDGVQVMDAIRKLQGEYDLVMVGRRHSDMSLRDEEMVDLVQNPELGVIGDMLASSDFCDGMVNVLVLLESKKS